jgi:hypothetical protein
MPNGLALAIILLILMLFLAYIISIVLNFLSPYYTTSRKDLKQLLDSFALKRDSKFTDLGSGDGRVIFSVYRNFKCKTHGYEISPMLLIWSKLLKFLRYPFNSRVEILEKSFFKEDLSQYDTIYCCLPEDILEILEKKFEQELTKGTKVFTYKYKLPNKKGNEVKLKVNKVYQYTF